MLQAFKGLGSKFFSKALRLRNTHLSTSSAALDTASGECECWAVTMTLHAFQHRSSLPQIFT